MRGESKVTLKRRVGDLTNQNMTKMKKIQIIIAIIFKVGVLSLSYQITLSYYLVIDYI